MASKMEPFEAVLEEVNGVTLLRLPAQASAALPSRGMVMAEGMLGETPFVAPAEPDGRGGHFVVVDAALAAAAGLRPGRRVKANLAPARTWPEPDMPADFLESLEEQGLMARWQACTVRGRWEWLRWMRVGQSEETRRRHIAVACDKLRKGDKRPCCFNAAACTVKEVCKGGALLEA